MYRFLFALVFVMGVFSSVRQLSHKKVVLLAICCWARALSGSSKRLVLGLL